MFPSWLFRYFLLWDHSLFSELWDTNLVRYYTAKIIQGKKMAFHYTSLKTLKCKINGLKLMQLVGKRTNVFVSYDHSVVEYISGFIGKKVAINQRCDDCFRVLMKQKKKCIIFSIHDRNVSILYQDVRESWNLCPKNILWRKIALSMSVCKLFFPRKSKFLSGNKFK